MTPVPTAFTVITCFLLSLFSCIPVWHLLEDMSVSRLQQLFQLQSVPRRAFADTPLQHPPLGACF